MLPSAGEEVGLKADHSQPGLLSPDLGDNERP